MAFSRYDRDFLIEGGRAYSTAQSVALIRLALRQNQISVKEKISVDEAQKLGKQLGVDYIVMGEIKEFRLSRDKGLYVPHLAGLPKTSVEMGVAVEMVDVANGALIYADVIEASENAGRGLNAFAGNREDRSSFLSSIDRNKLRQELLLAWRRNIVDKMFQDVTTIRQ